MPITQADTRPFIDPSLYAGYYNPPGMSLTNNPASNFLFGGGGDTVLQNQSGMVPKSQGSYYGIPTYGANQGQITSKTNPSDAGNWGLLSGIDPLGFFGGGSEGGWNPYIQDGKYYYTDPSKNVPVPVANVPGAPLKPSKNYQNTAANVQALTNMMPYLQQAVAGGILPTELANLEASKITSPQYAQMMTELYNTYGPQLNAIGSEIQKRNALAQAGTDLSVLQGPGTDLVKGAYDLSQVYDKPWYDARAAGSKGIQDLLGSIDLSGALSPTEIREIESSLARQGIQRGTQNAPSATDTVSNAMRFGQAGYQRQQQAKSNLSDAIKSASAFLPGAKSGVDVFQVATGRSSMPNPGAGQFTGITKPGDTSSQYGLAGSLLGGMNSSDINSANIEANKKDWLDKFNQFASGLGSLTSTAGSAAGMLGMCWVAREVYGEGSPKWREFRWYLFTKAPVWLFNMYVKYGEKFAKFISNKPFIKYLLRKAMDYAISSKTNASSKNH